MNIKIVKKDNETTPFACSICKKTFVRKHNLKRHIESHNPKRKFNCNICDRVFITKNGLKQHRNIHFGENTFTCYSCGKVFLRKFHMKRHLEATIPCEWTFNFKAKLSLQDIHQFEAGILLDMWT